MENLNKNTFLNGMSRVADPRKPYNQLHDFLAVIAIAALATLCGAAVGGDESPGILLGWDIGKVFAKPVHGKLSAIPGFMEEIDGKIQKMLLLFSEKVKNHYFGWTLRQRPGTMKYIL